MQKLFNDAGNYWYLPFIPGFSAGVAAGAGGEVVHVQFLKLLSLTEAFDTISEYLESVGRPPQSLCGMELRSPAPMELDYFDSFNEEYASLMDRFEVRIDGMSPVARTNVAPHFGAPTEIGVHGFSFVETKDGAEEASTYVIAGGADMNEDDGSLIPFDVTGGKDVEWDKVKWVVDDMRARIEALGISRRDPTVVNVFTALKLGTESEAAIVGLMEGAAYRGYHQWLSRPPVVGLDFELDVRRVHVERWL